MQIHSRSLCASWPPVKMFAEGSPISVSASMSPVRSALPCGDCTRTTYNLGVRWFLGDRDFAPFVGTAFSTTSASLAINHMDPMTGATSFLQGNGRAHSVSASGGLQLAVSYVRLSVEYIFEYVFYTGANLNDMQKTPSEDLRLVWEDSLHQDRHGVRFQVGFAF